MENDVKVEDFEKIGAAIAAKRSECDEIKIQLKAKNDELIALEFEAINLLDLTDRDNFPCKVGTMYKMQKYSVSMPKDTVEREKLFDHLRRMGVYNALVTINSATLNSFFKTEKEQAIERGDIDFAIPGLAEPKVYTTLGFRKS